MAQTRISFNINVRAMIWLDWLSQAERNEVAELYCNGVA